MVFIVVQGSYFPCHSSDVFPAESDDTQEPDGCRDTNPPRVVEFLTDQVAECGGAVDAAVAEEELAPGLSLFDGKEDGLHHVEHIDEGDVLRLVAHSEIGMCLDALRHHEVIAFAGTIDTRRTQDNRGEF